VRPVPAVLAMLVALAGGAAAHETRPEDILADLNSGQSRTTRGVEGAERSPSNPRVLVIRVGRGWYDLPPDSRRNLARLWLADWRKSVAQGIIAVLDARTDEPVVQFGAGGTVDRIAGPRTP